MKRDHSLNGVTQLHPGDHLCCLYESEDEHRGSLAPFLRQGLEQGEKVVYIAEDHTPQQVFGYLEDAGYKVAPHLANGQLRVVTPAETYLREGSFDPDKMIVFLRTETERAIAEGYPTLRVTGEMTWSLNGVPGSDRLIEYEAKLNHFFPGSPCLAICQYDRRRFSSDTVLGVLSTHPIAVVGSRMYENFYYIPPEDFLGPKPQEAMLCNWLNNLEGRAQGEEELYRTRDEWQLTFDGLADGMTIHDTEYNILLNNRAFAGLIPGGYREGIKCHQLVHGLDAPPAHCPMGEALASKKSKTSEFFEPWVNRYLSVRTDPVLDATGLVVRIIHVVRDITERKQMEEVLARSQAEAHYRELIENAAYGIFRSTLGGKFLYVNPALVEMLRYQSREELLSANIPHDIYPASSQSATVLEEMSQTQRVDSREIEWVGKDGKVINVRLSGKMVPDSQGKLEEFEAIVENVTERRLLEQQLYQSQKMESVGRLAGGVAHDFNNLLNVILGYSNLMLEHLSPEDPLCKRAKAIQQAGERAAMLTKQLLAFSRRQVLEPIILNLNTVVTEAKELLQRLIGEDIELNLALDPALDQVKVDPGQMSQIIMNLAVNARDAMPNGGKLSIETANIVLKDDYVARRPLVSPGPYVMMAVSDTGAGIDRMTQEHIFEPFFTTKEKGKGTGLGLSTVYGIVKQSGGFIWVYSEPGQGTTFKIYLPRVEERVSAVRVEESPGEFVASSETILLVEDDEALRELAREFLESAGYSVLEARSGPEAIEVVRGHEGSIHLLLTDVVLPGMSGPALSENLGATHPGMKVLYVSGYTDNEIVHRGVLDSQMAFLQKPYGKEALLTKIHKILG